MATANKNAPKPAVAKRAAPPTLPEEFAKKALMVVPKRAGFRRAGYAFPDGETTIPLADLTGEQYQQLTTEPMLVTFLVDLPAAVEAESGPAADNA